VCIYTVVDCGTYLIRHQTADGGRDIGGCDSTQYNRSASDRLCCDVHEVVSLFHSIFSLFHQPRPFACAYTKAQVATSSIIWRTRTMQVTGSYTLSFSPADHSDVSFLRQTKTVLSADRYQPFDRRTSQPRILKRCYIIRNDSFSKLVYAHTGSSRFSSTVGSVHTLRRPRLSMGGEVSYRSRAQGIARLRRRLNPPFDHGSGWVSPDR
jgi:hypothetical protein